MELDGETNLKTRGALADTAEMGDDLDAISRFDGEIVCEAPNNKLDKFQGKLIWQGKEQAITNENILLRGCILKNTRWFVFLRVLVWFTQLEIVLFLIAMCLICTVLCGVWEWTTGRWFTVYLPWDDVVPNRERQGSQQIAIISFLMFFSYVILLNTVVPISLYVSVEIIRFIHSLWINYDQDMYYENGDKSVPARAHTTTLNEELGQVQYVFSDKTGTLTRNIMTFNKCTINGISYGDVFDLQGHPIEITDRTIPLDFSWNSHYEQSFRFYDRKLLDATKIGTFEEVYELLCILDFNNERKRMSVITRNSQGQIKLYCKGADMMIMERRSFLKSFNRLVNLHRITNYFGFEFIGVLLKIPRYFQETAINIAYSCRLLTDEMKEIVVIDGQTHNEVEVQLKDTKKTFDGIMAMPSNVRDKPRFEIETIHDDGQETMSYGVSSSYSPGGDSRDGEGVALVINGDSLTFALGEQLERIFLEIATMCMAVICCRVTPLQKAQVVDLVKRNKKAVTLSIGDGANDVSMIKTAHIGVGISGQEGMQAVLASDYSIGQFRYLERLLLVHGRPFLTLCLSPATTFFLLHFPYLPWVLLIKISLVIFFIPYGAMYLGSDHSGRDLDDYSTLAFTTFTALIVVVTGQIAFDTFYWTAISHFVIWGSLIFYFLLAFLIYEALPVWLVAKTSSTVSYGIAFKTMATPQFWFSILMVDRYSNVLLPQDEAYEDHCDLDMLSHIHKALVNLSLRESYSKTLNRSKVKTEQKSQRSLHKVKVYLLSFSNSSRSARSVFPVSEAPSMITPMPNNLGSGSEDSTGPSSAGVPVMTLPYEPMRNTHHLTVNVDEWLECSFIPLLLHGLNECF
uniref:P-type phospholipid transporter n=1 Tax=Heterorhabditis bacteriophora TaxID=37862 RepID=A0A1I7XHX0_HETBA